VREKNCVVYGLRKRDEITAKAGAPIKVHRRYALREEDKREGEPICVGRGGAYKRGGKFGRGLRTILP